MIPSIDLSSPKSMIPFNSIHDTTKIMFSNEIIIIIIISRVKNKTRQNKNNTNGSYICQQQKNYKISEITNVMQNQKYVGLLIFHGVISTKLKEKKLKIF